MSPGQVTVRRATEQDLDAILRIERATPTAPHWSPAIYREMLAPNPASGRIRCVLVALAPVGAGITADQTVSGFVVAAAFIGAREGSAPPAELESVAVLDQVRRRGIGRALCVAAMDWANQMGAPAMELEVRAGNTAAVELYRSLGFRETARRPRYYQDPDEDAQLMTANLTSADPGLCEVEKPPRNT